MGLCPTASLPCVYLAVGVIYPGLRLDLGSLKMGQPCSLHLTIQTNG